MQVCTSLQTDNHTSTPPLSFLQAGCPSCRPTNSVKALKALKNTDENSNENSKINAISDLPVDILTQVLVVHSCCFMQLQIHTKLIQQ